MAVPFVSDPHAAEPRFSTSSTERLPASLTIKGAAAALRLVANREATRGGAGPGSASARLVALADEIAGVASSHAAAETDDTSSWDLEDWDLH